MAGAAYQAAINWIVEMDDNEWLPDYPQAPMSVTACMVRDLFQKTEEEVVYALRREQKRVDRQFKKAKQEEERQREVLQSRAQYGRW